MNFTHILDEQARHVAAVIAEARRRGARYVEPTEQAQTNWVANEGQPRSRSETYGQGPLAFHALLQQWRSTGMDDVLVDAPTQR